MTLSKSAVSLNTVAPDSWIELNWTWVQALIWRYATMYTDLFLLWFIKFFDSVQDPEDEDAYYDLKKRPEDEGYAESQF